MKCRRTRLNSEVIIREKILIVEETHDKKKEEVKPKISGEFLFGTKAVRRQYPHIFKVKIYSGTDNFQTTFRQQKDNLNYIYV